MILHLARPYKLQAELVPDQTRAGPSTPARRKFIYGGDSCKSANAETRRTQKVLKQHYDLRDTIDPILLGDIDEGNEWLTGRFDELDRDNEQHVLTEQDESFWRVAEKASGASQPYYQGQIQLLGGNKFLNLHQLTGQVYLMKMIMKRKRRSMRGKMKIQLERKIIPLTRRKTMMMN